MHRTFLEYFCAVEIVHRFEKQRTLTFEQLRNEIFGQHWQDETWHEVLRLICGMVNLSFVNLLIDFILSQTIDKEALVKSNTTDFVNLGVEGFTHLLLAADCLSDTKVSVSTYDIRNKVVEKLKEEIEFPIERFAFESAFEIFDKILQHSSGSLDWVKQQTTINGNDINGINRDSIQSAAVNAIAKHYRNQDTLSLLKTLLKESFWTLKRAATWAIPEYFCIDNETFTLLKENLKIDSRSVRCATISVLSRYQPINNEIFNLFADLIREDPFTRKFNWEDNPKQLALEFLLSKNFRHSEVLNLLVFSVENDPDEKFRQWAQEQLKIQNIKLQIEEGA
jgi:hypothetical protein